VVADKGGAILIVDDDPEFRGDLLDFLEGRGYPVFAARDATEAFRLMQLHAEIELLVTDVVIPGSINGFDLAAAAGRLRPGMKVVYMSGYAAADLIGAALPEPPAILRKPFWFEKLHQVIGATLALPHAPGS
jgi:DNA-binding NtrC family response regulator